MTAAWTRDYTYLALRMHKRLKKISFSPFVDGYFGPPEWKTTIEAEAMQEPQALLEAAQRLTTQLPQQDFSIERKHVLKANMRSLETICRLLCGEQIPLRDLVERCLDIRPSYIPDSYFEEARRIHDEVLPGKGTIFDRLRAWHRRRELPWEKRDLLTQIVPTILAELRRRTAERIGLPEGETLDLHFPEDMRFGGGCFYQGNYRSCIELNKNVPPKLYRQFDTLCHECYPGHHTEFVHKDQFLYRQRGFEEVATMCLLTPAIVISEGIAMQAREILFEPEEAYQWLGEQITTQLGRDLDSNPLEEERIMYAQNMLEGVACNAALMQEDSKPDEEVREYMIRYLRGGADLDALRDPIERIYIFSYHYGTQLLRPHLQGPQRLANFRLLLQEPLLPSDLQKREPI
ncbi:conserved hypothetical protein [Ktedonobacter racemifer DSM 44963]|uniref:DUF885 domain-containing protein n=2 Tax=Ktedonobacter racemifer TaxID=363277 RepID=D6TG03_KTERA|nr:conserved hypothetical protein [Ktedonobacter racemifer DSM 44963]